MKLTWFIHERQSDSIPVAHIGRSDTGKSLCGRAHWVDRQDRPVTDSDRICGQCVRFLEYDKFNGLKVSGEPSTVRVWRQETQTQTQAQAPEVQHLTRKVALISEADEHFAVLATKALSELLVEAKLSS